MKFEIEDDLLTAKINYETITENGLTINIDNIYSLSEYSAYFDWALEGCGYGQFSLSYKNGNWFIMNECMGPESSYDIVKAFEEAVRSSGDESAIYCLNKMISHINFYSNSLAKSVLLIWNTAEKEGKWLSEFITVVENHKKNLDMGNHDGNMILTKESLVTDNVTVYTLIKNEYSFSNKKGSFYEITLEGFFDIKNGQYGYLYLAKIINIESNEKEWVIAKNLNSEMLEKIFKTLEESTYEHEKVWKIWKEKVKLDGDVSEIVKQIIGASREKKIGYPIKL